MFSSSRRNKCMLLVVILFTGCTATMNKICTGGWNQTDTLLESAALGLTVVDWRQTETITRNPDRYYETNPILGTHPSSGFVNGYFALVMLHPIVSCLLPPPLRKTWITGTIYIEGITTWSNYKLGLKP